MFLLFFIAMKIVISMDPFNLFCNTGLPRQGVVGDWIFTGVFINSEA